MTVLIELINYLNHFKRLNYDYPSEGMRIFPTAGISF